MLALLLCCHFTALCTSKGDIGARAICYIWRFIILYLGLPRLLAVSVVFPIAISLCSMLQHTVSQQLGGS